MRFSSLLCALGLTLLLAGSLLSGPLLAADDAAATGKAVYEKTCAACHATGVAGAPKLGDKEGWGPLLDKSIEQMTGVVISGKGAMPAKGGNPQLSDDEIRAAVSYMLEQVR